jgi:GNAT superfamily N-acetyltransferase
MSLEVIVRAAGPGDIAELQRIYRAASLSNAGDRDALLRQPEYLVFTGSGIEDGRTLVALVDERPVGFASTADGDSTDLELEDLFVDPTWQRRGIARQLIAAVAGQARARGAKSLLVTGNPHAEAFYLSVGFVQFGEKLTELGSGPRLRLDLASDPAEGA